MSVRPVESSHSLIVSWPIRVVHAFVADFRHAALWDPATVSIEMVGDGPARVGCEWTTRSTLAGRTSTGHYRLEWSTPYGVVLVGRHPGLTRTVEFALVDLGDHTEIHLTMRYHRRGLTAASRRGQQRHALVELTGRAASRLPVALEARAAGRDTAEGGDPGRGGPPSHLVDRWYLGWRLTGMGDGTTAPGTYLANPTGPDDGRTYDDLAATRAPLRPVVAPSAADVHEIDHLLAGARDRAAPTIAAAIHAAYALLRDIHPRLNADVRDGLAKQRLTAASEGTPPAAALLALLSQRKPAATTIDPAARDGLTRMIIRWIGHPDHYTDVAVALLTLVPPRLMPGPMRRARRTWIRTDPTLSLANAQPAGDAFDPEGRYRHRPSHRP